MRNDKVFQVQGIACAKALRQERQLWPLLASPHSSSMTPPLQAPWAFPVCSHLPVCVAPPVPGPLRSNYSGISSVKSSVAHQALGHSHCSVSPQHLTHVSSLVFTKSENTGFFGFLTKSQAPWAQRPYFISFCFHPWLPPLSDMWVDPQWVGFFIKRLSYLSTIDIRADTCLLWGPSCSGKQMFSNLPCSTY